MTGWNSKPEWPDLSDKEKAQIKEFWDSVVNSVTVPEDVFKDAQLHGVDYMQDGKHVPLEKEYNNKMPTHDPYTNPNAQVYYECKCGVILDPGTKSFAALNNAASDKGWKVRWKQNGEGYEPFCVECGKDVE